MADPPPYPGAPRWVKVSGIAVGALVMLAVILLLNGGGPRRHLPSGDQEQPSGAIKRSPSSGGGFGMHMPHLGGHP